MNSRVPGWRYRNQEWADGTARVVAHLDSIEPRWVMQARRGRNWWLDIAGGPLRTRELAQATADALNRLDRVHWDYFLCHELPARLAGRKRHTPKKTRTPRRSKQPGANSQRGGVSP